MHDVPPDCTVVGAPARIVKLAGDRVDRELVATQLPGDSIPVDL
jgi:serine acetyltransferase